MNIRKDLRLISVLTKANLKSRYRNTFYGFIWVLLNPILTYAVQVFAFTIIFQVKMANYAVYLLAGLFPWLFIVQSVEMCTGIFIYNASIIKNIPIPPLHLVFVQVLDNFINFFCAFVILIFYFIFFHSLHAFTVFYVILPIIALLIAVNSMCVLFSLLSVRFRDLKFVISFAFSLLFYLTPIFYSVQQLPERVKVFIVNNPLYYLIRPFQDLMIGDFSGDAFFHHLILSFSFSFILFALAYICWSKMKKYMVFYV